MSKEENLDLLASVLVTKHPRGESLLVPYEAKFAESSENFHAQITKPVKNQFQGNFSLPIQKQTNEPLAVEAFSDQTVAILMMGTYMVIGATVGGALGYFFGGPVGAGVGAGVGAAIGFLVEWFRD